MKSLCFYIILCLIIYPIKLLAIESDATALLVFDQNTQTILLSRNPNKAIPPASMSKLMTLNMVFEALQAKRITLDSMFIVSKKAQDIGGSTMFLRQGELVSIKNLLRGIIVQSGNDACIVIAEGLAGSEAEFARQMTKRAKALGMNTSKFANSTGWPHPKHYMSARDLVFIANRLIVQFPEFYHYFAEEKFTWDNITQANRNPLLKLNIGADGLKTGHTEEAGYGMVGSVKQGARRIIFAISGLQSKTQRAEEAKKLTDWAFNQFTSKLLFNEQESITSVDIWLGKQTQVELLTQTPIEALVPHYAEIPIKLHLSYNAPIVAPFTQDQPLAMLIVTSPTLPPVSYPLYPKSAVQYGGFLARLRASSRLLLQRFLPNISIMNY